MSRPKKLSRRRFIQITATVAAAGPAISCTKTVNLWRFFTVQEARTLQAICERIIPADQDPGAAEASVVNYIDRQLMGHFKRHQRAYREGILRVNQTSLALFGKEFVALATEGQTMVLVALEKNEAPGEIWKGRSAARFFDLVVTHTMQGFYGDPRHGGNREGVSWKMLGVPYPPVRGRLHYDLSKSPNRQGT